MANWNERFIQKALHTSTWSKDPRAQCGCVAVDVDRNEVSSGYNGFPRNVKDDERLNNRDTKLQLIVHAEANMVAAAARKILKGTTVYINRHPCSQCAGLLIQADIIRIVFRHDNLESSSWKAQNDAAALLLAEAGVELVRL